MKMDSFSQLLESPTGFQHDAPGAKAADPNEPFTSRSEPTPKCGHNMTFLKNITEDIPRISTREVDPHIWGMHSAIYFET
ncbi:hypothetical protein HanXRQr2_Chr05g0201141 [Helianthus annuus]|uniref:Uncharacterized protein n=1 Tax=Helianthus annuus TaxID=4232 RepID=A0A9K3IY43_HELAN|nr:hypothetical protein HanXRQr2_Chr05g0201141 [Helianthus annuus]